MVKYYLNSQFELSSRIFGTNLVDVTFSKTLWVKSKIRKRVQAGPNTELFFAVGHKWNSHTKRDNNREAGALWSHSIIDEGLVYRDVFRTL